MASNVTNTTGGTVSFSGPVTAAAGASAVAIGAVGAGNASGITFQNNEAGSNLYRVAAGTLRSDGVLQAVSYIHAQVGAANQVLLGYDGAVAGSAPAVCLGSAGDTNLVRTAANTVTVKNILISDLQPSQASLTTARTGGAAAALPAAPVKYLALRDDTGARVYVPAYS